MADLRYPLFFIALGFWLLVSFWLSITLTLLNPKEFSFYSTFALITMTLTCVAVLFAAVGSYMQTAQGFVPLFVWLVFFSAKSANLFSSENIVTYWLVTIALWLGMYFWWFQWQPKKYLVNCMTLSAVEMQKQQSNVIQSVTFAFSALPKTLIGSMLIGSSDGIKSWLKRELGLLVIFLVALAYILYWSKTMPESSAGILIAIYVFVFICIRGGIIFQNCYRNLYRLWMGSQYTRAELLGCIERRYFLLASGSIISMALLFALVNTAVLTFPISFFHSMYLLLISSLVVVVSFYLGLLIYIKSAASLVVLNWIGPIVNLCLVGIMVYLNILWGSNASYEHAHYLWFSGALLALILLGRMWVKSSWKKVNFYRVKN